MQRVRAACAGFVTQCVMAGRLLSRSHSASPQRAPSSPTPRPSSSTLSPSPSPAALPPRGRSASASLWAPESPPPAAPSDSQERLEWIRLPGPSAHSREIGFGSLSCSIPSAPEDETVVGCNGNSQEESPPRSAIAPQKNIIAVPSPSTLKDDSPTIHLKQTGASAISEQGFPEGVQRPAAQRPWLLRALVGRPAAPPELFLGHAQCAAAAPLGKGMSSPPPQASTDAVAADARGDPPPPPPPPLTRPPPSWPRVPPPGWSPDPGWDAVRPHSSWYTRAWRCRPSWIGTAFPSQRVTEFSCLVVLARIVLFILCGCLLVVGMGQAGMGLWLLLTQRRLLHATLGSSVTAAALAALAGGGTHLALGGLTGIFSAFAPGCCVILHMAIGASAAAGAVTSALLEHAYEAQIIASVERNMAAEIEAAKHHSFYVIPLHGLQRTFGCCAVHKFTEWCTPPKSWSNASASRRDTETPRLKQKWDGDSFRNLFPEINRKYEYNSGQNIKPITQMVVTRRGGGKTHVTDYGRTGRIRKGVEDSTLLNNISDESPHYNTSLRPPLLADVFPPLPPVPILSTALGLTLKQDLQNSVQAQTLGPLGEGRRKEEPQDSLPPNPCTLPGSCCDNHRDESDCSAVPPYTNVYNAGCLKSITALMGAAGAVYRSANISASILLLFAMALALFIHCFGSEV